MASASVNDNSHSFGQEHKQPGETRTLIVIAVTAVMMGVEITTGIIFGSMALLADGLHMASHAAALSITALAYVYARRHAHDTRFSFGTGKVNALGGFTGAVLLAVFALMMAVESTVRLVNPVEIAFNQAIFVAVIGLVVNVLSMFILGSHKSHGHGHHGHDQNLRSAYLHVLADALTSFLAIFALLAAKYFGLVWMDPVMGIIGAVLVSRWSVGLLRSSGRILLDHQAPEEILHKLRNTIEALPDTRVDDLHVWAIGPGMYAAILSVAARNPESPAYYKQLLTCELNLVHVSIEVIKAR